MVADLCHEPRRVPADLAARVADELLEILPIERARQRAGRVRLVCVRLALMPQHGAKATRTERFQARGERGKGRALALPRAVRELPHATDQRGRIRKRRPPRQPFAHAGRADAAGDQADGHLESLGDRVAERREEAAALTAGAGLGIVGRLPACPIEGGHQTGLRAQLLLAMVGGVRLSRHDEHLAHAHVRCLRRRQ